MWTLTLNSIQPICCDKKNRNRIQPICCDKKNRNRTAWTTLKSKWQNFHNAHFLTIDVKNILYKKQSALSEYEKLNVIV